MLNHIVEFIQNSVTAVVGLTVGILGIGAGDFNLQDASLPKEDVKISENLPKNSSLLSVFDAGSQVANIAEAVKSEDVKQTTAVEEIQVSNNLLVASSTGNGDAKVEIKYLDRTNAKPVIFVRPTNKENEVSSSSGSDLVTTPVVVQETESTRVINPIKSTGKTKDVDVSLILGTDFDKFNFNLQIIEITEDGDYFYSTYQFRSLAIKNNAWQRVTKKRQIIVAKVILGDQDLGDYLSEELGEVIDNEKVFLKEVQEIQRMKQVKAKVNKKTKVTTTGYSALIGKILDIKGEQFDNYTPTKKPIVDEKDDRIVPPFEQVEQIEQIEETEKVVEKTTDMGVVDNEAPLIIIQGNNPALIQIGSTYADLGAKVTDNISNNLGVIVGGDIVDTSKKGSYFVAYTAEDEAGNVATATREVIVYDYGVAPKVEEISKVTKEKEEVKKVEKVEKVETPVVDEKVEEVKKVETVADLEIPAVEEGVKKVEKVGELIVEKEITTSDNIATTTDKVLENVVTEDASSTTEVEREKATGLTPTEKTTDVVVENVKKVKKEKVSKKVKEAVVSKAKTVIETTKDTTKVIVGAVVETTTATVEQVSEAVKTVDEEVSAMIKAVHFLELLGNIRSTLQASISTAGDGTSNIAETTGQFFKTIAVNIAEVVDNTVDTVVRFFKRITDGVVGVANLVFDDSRSILQVSQTSKVLNSISGATGNRNDSNSGERIKLSGYQKENFLSFIFRQVLSVPKIIMNKIINTTTGLTATVGNYSKTVGSDLETVGKQLDQKIDKINFSPKGIIQTIGNTMTKTFLKVFGFFKSHRPQ